MRRFTFISALTLIFSVAGCGSMEQIQSPRAENTITIDGSDAEWQGQLTYYDDPKLAIGVKHDDQNLYLCIETEEPRVARQLVQRGITVWLDADGGKHETFGIHFPTGMLRNMQKPEPTNPSDEDEGIETPQDETDSGLEMVEILGAKKEDTERMRLTQLPGITLKIGTTSKVFVYELQVPLRTDANHPYAINCDGKSPIGIGIKTGTFKIADRSMDSENFSMGGRSGMRGMSGGGTMGGGMHGGRSMGGRGSKSQVSSKGVDFWVKADPK